MRLSCRQDAQYGTKIGSNEGFAQRCASPNLREWARGSNKGSNQYLCSMKSRCKVFEES
jgi:hypothetical protein